MKNFILTSFLILACFFSFVNEVYGTVHTVSNNPNSPGEYFDVQSAINAAVVDDTIYVHGSNILYPNFTINKRLVLIGAGFNVTGTQFNLNTRTSNITNDSVNNIPISGSKIIGFDAQLINGNKKIHNVIIERNKIFTLNLIGNFWVVRNNIINNLNLWGYNAQLGYYSSDDCLVSNNIINRIFGTSAVSSGVVITHNFIIEFINYGVNNVIINNIFQTTVAGNGIQTGVTNSVISNNITYGSSAQVLPTPGNSGSNNLSQNTPSFVNVPNPVNTAQLINYNYAFNAGSPGINVATDGTNIGPTGGSYPMNIFHGVSWLPQMVELNIHNPVIAPGDPLNINFKARKRN